MAKRTITPFITLEASRKTVEKWDNEVRKMASEKRKTHLRAARPQGKR